MTPPHRSKAVSSWALALAQVTLLLGILVAAPAATAGEKALVQKLATTGAATPITVPLPITTIQRLGATVVEDYEAMAVVDLGTTTAEALAQATGLMVSPLPDQDKVLLRDYTLLSDGGLPPGLEAPPFPADVPNLSRRAPLDSEGRVGGRLGGNCAHRKLHSIKYLSSLRLPGGHRSRAITAVRDRQRAAVRAAVQEARLAAALWRGRLREGTRAGGEWAC